MPRYASRKCLTKKSISHVSFSTSNAMPYGRYLGVGQLAPAALKHLDERHRLAVERGMLGRRRRAEVRLQRHVAEILERQHAEVGGVTENPRHRHRHRGEQLRRVHERQRGVVERRRVDRQHERLAVLRQHAEIAAIGRVAGERHDHAASIDAVRDRG